MGGVLRKLFLNVEPREFGFRGSISVVTLTYPQIKQRYLDYVLVSQI